MPKKTALMPSVLVDSAEGEKETFVSIHPPKRKFFSMLGFGIGLVLIVGAVVLIVVSSMVGYWLQHTPLPNVTAMGATATPLPATTFKVGRHASYAGLDMTVVNAQYAPAFSDDLIHSGATVVRLNMQITNHTNAQVDVVYYEIAHLLIPQLPALAPTNINLVVDPTSGTSKTGWIDFSVPQAVQLDTLTLQLGSTSLNEALVKIPFGGSFNADQYADKVSPQNAEFDYSFSDNTLNYHLTSVETRFAFQGKQCKAGQRFYTLNFKVDNQNGVDVSPGYGYDYIRMIVNGYGNPPIGNSLPYGFKAGKNGTSGSVVFSVQAGLRNFSLAFLSQNGNGQEVFDVSI